MVKIVRRAASSVESKELTFFRRLAQVLRLHFVASLCANFRRFGTLFYIVLHLLFPLLLAFLLPAKSQAGSIARHASQLCSKTLFTPAHTSLAHKAKAIV